MIRIERATREDSEELTRVQVRTFEEDNKLKPSGSSMEGPPGSGSVEWNSKWIEKTPYYKILLDDQIVGGLIIFNLGEGVYELGRIFVDPDCQNQGIGQQALKEMFDTFPQVKKWILETPCWAIRNRHFYEKMGFVKVGETEVDPNLGWSEIEYEKHNV